MNQRLSIGVQHLTNGWEAILNDIGVWFEELDYTTPFESRFSLIILNKKPDSDQFQKLKKFVRSGGALLELKGTRAFFNADQVSRSPVKTLINTSGHEAFGHIPFLDLHAEAEFHMNSSIFNGLVQFEALNDGHLCFMGCNIPKLINSIGHKRKRFYSKQSAIPDEIVSTVSKHEVMELLRSTIAHLHYQQGLPFITKWISPTQDPVFCFRIDSDFGDQNSIQKVYDALRKYKIKATWFLHVQAHEEWLDLFKDFEDQELALHGYRHGTSKSKESVIHNIKRGSQLLESLNYDIEGFCAPYGIWNEALEKALTDFNFKYTSEFTFKYGGYPAHSPGNEKRLQIPIHPICTGSMNRQKYSLNGMKEYFLQVLEYNSARFEPTLFYHHPLQPGLEVFDDIFKQISGLGYINLTFSEYADFWMKREVQEFEPTYKEDKIWLNTKASTDLLFQVSTHHKSFGLLGSSDQPSYLQRIPKTVYASRYIPSENEITEMRNTDLRLLKTSLLDWKNRIRL